MAATTVILESYRKNLFEFLDETFDNVHGIYLDKGTSLFETLATISAEEASRPVSATCASISAQVEHVRFYVTLLARYARGEDVGEVDWDATWTLRDVTDEEWSTLKEGLREAYNDIRELLADDRTFEHEDALGGSMAIVAHTAYHLGEIRQALCTVKG
jgi:hypothetical protein